jgi:hypothetical protein
LRGTAGFGFWNAPFGDPTIRTPALPQAAWFFFASAPGDLPLAQSGPGRGWFASTIAVTAGRGALIAALSPAILLLNQFSSLRHIAWPGTQCRLGISYRQLETPMQEWHTYHLDWLATGCRFVVDGVTVHETPHCPQGPLGFVCWMDNQYLTLTARGRFGWGVLPIRKTQWLDIEHLQLSRY